MNASLRSGRGPLITVLSSGTIGWLFFVAGIYADVSVEAGLRPEELYGGDALDLIYPSAYFTFLAIAALAVGSLIAKRNILKRPVRVPSIRAALSFTNIAMVVSLILAASAGVAVFMNGFLSEPAESGSLARTLNVYVPIVLYTVLIVAVLVVGFVMMRHTDPAEAPSVEPEAPVQRNALAVAFALPIVAIAIALIFGLIVYDVTRTAPEVWIWVIIQAVVAAGIIVGTAAARRARGQGARLLNLVLSIIFITVVAIMSLGYGSSAVRALTTSPHLALNVYEDEWMSVDSRPEGTPVEDLSVNANGFDLERHSEATVTLNPAGEVVLDDRVARDGYLNLVGDLRPTSGPGEYTLDLQAHSEAGDLITVTLDVTILDGGRVAFPEGTHVSVDAEVSELLPVTVSWLFGDLIPALLLWLLVCVVAFLTLTLRHVPMRINVSEETER